MNTSSSIKALFLDLGGVVLTNGWDRHSRQKAVEQFQLDPEETKARHDLLFDLYERGRLTLNDYLDGVVFYQPRAFSKDTFKQFMFEQSRPFPAMIEWIRQLKSQYGFKIVTVNNEGKELMEHRIVSFHLKEWIDFFVSSCFIGMRKPDKAMYRLALNLTQVEPHQVIYIDDRLLLTEVAQAIGMHVIHHVEKKQTEALLDILLKPPQRY